MGTNAQVMFDYIEVATQAWVQARTSGPLDDLTQQHDEYVTELNAQPRPVAGQLSGVETLHRFIATRAGETWSRNDGAILEPDTGEGIVSLSESVLIFRYLDPEHGRVAFVTEVTGAGTGAIRAYSDTVKEPGDWCTFGVQIWCANRHSWTYRSAELIDAELTSHRPVDIFPHGEIITRIADRNSPTHGQYVILCPQCGAPCDVELSPL